MLKSPYGNTQKLIIIIIIIIIIIFSCLQYLTAVGAARIFVSDDVGRRRISANTVKTTVTIVVYFTAAKTDKYIQGVLKKMNRFEIVLNFVKLLVVL